MPSDNLMRRYQPLAGLKVETRARQDGSQVRVITGHASVFDAVYDVGGMFRERFVRGAFRDSIARGDDVRALIEHDPSQVIGRVKAGSLRLAEDERGLAVSIELPDTQRARDLIVEMESGLRDQMSIGFRTVDDEWDESDPEQPLRTVRAVNLFDVSIVTFPASEVTGAQVRALQSMFEEHRRQQNKANAMRRLRMQASQDHRKRGLTRL